MLTAAQLCDLLLVVEHNFRDDLQILSLGLDRADNLEGPPLSDGDIAEMRAAIKRSASRCDNIRRLLAGAPRVRAFASTL